MIDRSDAIALLQVLEGTLINFNPDGEWRQTPVYLKWKRCSYSLTQREAKALIKLFEDGIKATKAHQEDLKYKQQSLFDEREAG